ncbi:AAA family ATPase [Dactylosporangium aurantiacum]|uniref:AAA family ATPase n=1 Tax=Dactylosporangium aurantiacum TaxID=35754 RepID=A0A9Q9MMI3_9ACTN|nr:AAA family ATPase [Dactylosporangium aurantiacum]MDG6106311.1 AAA family ATPase [Dactylosporangium aurantiacum]UWZ58196.1 AAA family ATPase [Dactylosporangium aurantiacum]
MTRVPVCGGGTVIRKEPLGPEARRRAQHETAILERLRGVEGVAQLLDAPAFPGSVVLADVGGESLTGTALPLPAGELLDLAVALTRAVAGMHRRGVLHRDIAPTNIVVSRTGAPCLVDFDLASFLAELRPRFTHHTEIVGTLPYLAPEQTGRTGRSIDHRADLYALGATLYELAAGAPPFGSGDPLRLTHDHLARVPVPPPGPLSRIIMHLLEKEPDNRYQTAEGLLADLERVRAGGPGAAAGLRVGEHDVPLRLLPPSRLAGRAAEVAVLKEAFEGALAGRCRGVLIGGASGVGKTALVDELRPVVTGGNGWFVTGKFDQHRRDMEFNGLRQAYQALGRLLLAEPEHELAQVHERLLAAVGPNAGLLAAVAPEFAALLGRVPDPGDPLTAHVRAQRLAVDVMRAVASPKRPVVMFVDDLQWAGQSPLEIIELLLEAERLDGLLMVCAYRAGDADGARTLAAPLARWRERPGVRHLRLGNLPVSGTVTMVAEMLHVDPARATGLGKLIHPYTSGNPYETVELLNALRRDGVLRVSAAGWQWDAAAVRARLGRSEVAGLLAARVRALPPATRQLVEVMACLGGRAELGVLRTATAVPEDLAEQRLAPALDDGLLVLEPGTRPTVRFRHDRVHEVVLRGLGPRCRPLRLATARRLAAVPALFMVAAEQYLPVVDAVGDAEERGRVVRLLRRAAGQAQLAGDHAVVAALLAATLRLVDPGDTGTLVEVRTCRHAALYGLGRLEEADEEYRAIEGLTAGVMDRADATGVQVRSLTHRGRLGEAIDLGVAALRELGVTVPAEDPTPGGLDELYRWLDRTGGADELTRSEISDPALLAATHLLTAVLTAAYLAAHYDLYSRLSLEALRMWLEHGPGPTLVGPVGAAATVAVLHGDLAAGYRVLRRILALGEARGYEADLAQVRFLHALRSCWFEPLENSVETGRQAREGLLAAGDLTHGAFTYYATVVGLLDTAPSLDGCVAEVEAGLAFMRRTGSEQSGWWLDSYRWLADVLRGECSPAPVEAATARYAGDPLALFHAHVNRAFAAAVLGDPVGLAQHTAAAMPLLPAAPGLYPTALAYLLRGLSLAGQARDSHGDDRGALLAELDEATRWLADRAVDAPANFLHLVRLVEAEQAWAVGDFHVAALAFDAARHEAVQRGRPWHAALISEHAGRFCLAHGVEHAGHSLLLEARQEYLAWGATAKVHQLDWAYPTLRPPPDRHGDAHRVHSSVTTGTIDLLGILSASRALSSQTRVEGLHTELVRALGAITGATQVRLVLWSGERQDWLLPAPGGVDAVRVTGDEHAVPLSVLRYVQRAREPLVVGDVTRDDRFARDPYLAGLGCCSMLAVPIVNRGTLQAVLLLENRLIRGAFSVERLDAVKLIAGQLAVSLDNARLYADYRRIANEQAALRRVATLVARGAGPDTVFAAVADEVGALFDAESTAVIRFEAAGEATVMGGFGITHTAIGTRMRLDPRSAMAAVQVTGRAARCHAVYRSRPGSTGRQSVIAGPILVEGRLWGAVVATARRDRLDEDAEQRLAGFNELLATGIANAESRAELTTSRARIVATADQTRRRIERDLHDGAQQRLVALALQLRTAQADVPPQLDALGRQLDRAVAAATAAADEVREIAHGIHPGMLTEGGLGPALRGLARRSPVPVELGIRTVGRLPERVEVSAYYIVAEALTNAAKHAQASTITVTVDVVGTVLRVTVCDDGVGGADFAGGTGLVGLKDRAEALGGSITLSSPHGRGTRLAVEIPTACEPEAPGPTG